MPHRNIATLLIIVMVLQTLAPVSGYALSGGNKAPEFESFQPFGLDNMVDPATGDFSYNIPLMNVGFHGINLSYQAGVTMDQEATMVGLGWNINSGMINRTVRGIPDDFNEDIVIKEKNERPDFTVGLNFGVEAEAVGFDVLKLKGSIGVSYNNINKIGFDWSISPSVNLAEAGCTGLTAGLGLSSSSHGGVSLEPTIGIGKRDELNEGGARSTIFSIGSSINSRGGMKGISMSGNFGISESKSIKVPSTSFSLLKPSFVPQVDFPRKNTSVSFSAAAGADAFTFFPGGFLSGYYSKSSLAVKRMEVPAFGCLYPSTRKYTGMLDFHRANDMPYNEDIPNLAVPVMDYDIYTVAGPGLSGTLQLRRGDFGLVEDRQSNSTSSDNSLGLEFGAGALAHVGGVLTSVSSTSTVTGWRQNNNLVSAFSFNADKEKIGYEEAHFRKADEFLVQTNSHKERYDNILNEHAIRPVLKRSAGLTYEATGELKTKDGETTNLRNIDVTDIERLKRKSNITFLNFNDAEAFGYSNYIDNNIYTTLLGSLAKPHHIAEITVENEDGYKYIYGLPVYNIEQIEKTFSVGTPNDSEADLYGKGLVGYDTGDDGTGNQKGLDHFYSSSELPPFVTSYLLTAIVSSDYQDRGRKGPSPEDYGDYVKFSYEQGSNFNWRTPYTTDLNKASHNPGLLTLPDDDKANYIYGVRQTYWPTKIENKSEIAIYGYYKDDNGVILPRKDGASAAGISGGKGDVNPRALEKITKYSRPDYNRNDSEAEPLKTVYFQYNYDLCPGALNSDSGKLTLSKLYMQNGTSKKGRFSPYVFEYGLNPYYNPKAVNRWGGYQSMNTEDSEPLSISKIEGEYNLDYDPIEDFDDPDYDPTDGDLTTVNFPYVPQENREAQDLYASAWNLSKIKLPSGADISIDYEADDYAYVQDKTAMQMFNIIGFSSSVNSSTIRENIEGNEILYDGGTNNLYAFFDLADSELREAISDDQSAKRIIEKHYLKDIKNGLLYFKVFGNVWEEGGTKYEYIPGWTRIDDYGAIKDASGEYKAGYVKLRSACLKGRLLNSCFNEINPISKSIIQTTRLNMPQQVWGGNPIAETGAIEQAIRALVSTFTQIPTFVTGVNVYLKGKKIGDHLKLNKSVIRLYNPSKTKIAGSHRVRSLVMNDNWNNMADPLNKSGIYGKRFIYSQNEKTSDFTRKISTGVAAYEPAVGGEENPFRIGIPFKEELLLAPDNTKYQEEPLMEDYFPSPQIIYSSVITKDLFTPENSFPGFDEMLVYENTGFTESQFYTYKDYPIRTENTTPDDNKANSPLVTKFLKMDYRDYLTTSQGYSIINPLMHGKPKANYVFNASGQRISGQEFEYLENGKGQLSDEVKVLQSDGTLTDATMGIDYHLFADIREATSITNTSGATANTETFLAAIFPILLPAILPKFGLEERKFRSVVLAKSVKQNGILKKTTSINGIARIETENLLWDAETGDPILTRTTNEFEDPIYNVTLPAHIAYKGMGQAYQNMGAEFSNVLANPPGVVNANANFLQNITEGDKLVVYPENTSEDTYFTWVLHSSDSEAYLVDKYGRPSQIATSSRLKIIDSGYSNQAGTPIASYVSLENPIVNNALELNESIRMIDASVTEFKDKWQTYCGDEKFQENLASENLNPQDGTDYSDQPNLITNGDFELGNELFTNLLHFRDVFEFKDYFITDDLNSIENDWVDDVIGSSDPNDTNSYCWDINGNGKAESYEDVNNDGVYDELDCNQQDDVFNKPCRDTTNNYNCCWDLNNNGFSDAFEDTNGDLLVNEADCCGKDDLVFCWDINRNGIKDEREDVNKDGVHDYNDCCWDINKNGLSDSFEDLNDDDIVDHRDCCWDGNQNMLNDLSEDLNGDGIFNFRDCQSDSGGDDIVTCDLGDDHGNVMIVNDSQDADTWAELFCQEIELEANSDYSITFDYIGLDPSCPVSFFWAIDFSPITEFSQAPQEICEWDSFEFEFTVPETNTYNICLMSQIDRTCNPGTVYGIDNIELQYNGSSDAEPEPSEPQDLPDFACLPFFLDTINPFLHNVRGNWRPVKSYVFQTDRLSSDNIQVDGSYTTLSNNYKRTLEDFWIDGSDNSMVPHTDGWTWTTENTMVSPFGMEIEARDPLDRFSAELTGYNNQKVVAVAANAKYNDIAYYGAEIRLFHGMDVSAYAEQQYDNRFLNWLFEIICPVPYHTNVINGERVTFSNNWKPNSGNYALRYSNNGSTVIEFKTTPAVEEDCQEMDRGPFIVQDCDCIPVFEPSENKEYLLSAWLYHPCLQSEDCNAMPQIKVRTGSSVFDINEYGPLIEGWRKVEGAFRIEEGDAAGRVELDFAGGEIFLDDLRIHPYNASMKTYNYDQKTLRFTFEHDDNNFFTRYDYALDGTLQRISKQTERGVLTLQESKFGQRKTDD